MLQASFILIRFDLFLHLFLSASIFVQPSDMMSFLFFYLFSLFFFIAKWACVYVAVCYGFLFFILTGHGWFFFSLLLIYFLIGHDFCFNKLGEIFFFFGWFFVYFFLIEHSFFNKNIWVNLYQFHFSSSHFFSPTK